MLFETLGITWQLVLQALLWSLVTAVVWFVIKLYNVRSRMLALQRQGLVRNIEAPESLLPADH